MNIQTSLMPWLRMTLHAAKCLLLLHLVLAPAHAFADVPEALVERRMDPSLRLLYRAAKGKAGMSLARATEIHERIHKKGKAKGNKNALPTLSSSRLQLLVRYAGPASDLEAAGFDVEAKVGDVFTGTVTTDRLAVLAELPQIRLLQSSTTLSSDVPKSTEGTSSSQPVFRSPLSTAATHHGSLHPNDLVGTGVIIGFVDTGVDIFHADFRKPDGTTRIKYLLDFSDPGDLNADGRLDGTGPYGGTLYTEAQINAALTAGTIREKDTTGHGTHGLSIAAGSDASLPGIAPAADLIVVKATRNSGTLSFTSSDIVNALAFIDAKAAELGKPYVANLSLGTLFSSHDGRSLEEQAIDALVGPGVAGKAVVVAAGNSSDNRGTFKRHFSGTTYVGLPVLQTLTIPTYTPNPGKGNDRIVLDLWYKGNDKLKVKVTSPGGTLVTAAFGDYADVQTPDGDVFISNLGGVNPDNGDVESIVLIDDWTGPVPQSGNWTLSVEATEIGSTGVFDGWLSDESTVGTKAPNLGGGADNLLLIGKPGAAYNAVTVASFARHLPGSRFLTSWTDVNGIVRTDTTALDGDISDFSSPGSTRDGRRKPDVAAPGERVMGAVSRDAIPGVSPDSIYIYHPFPQANALLTDQTTNHAFGMLQGTSFSAPVVTGLAARILSANRNLDAIQVRNILINSATADSFTGAVPNNFWGYGKVNQSIGTAPLPNDLRIIPDTLPASVINEQYNFVLTASGGTLPYSWFVVGGSLPPGLTLESRGFLSGKPATAGSYPVTIQVADSTAPAKTATRSYTIVIASASNLHITTVAQPVGNIDKAYKSQLDAAGGTPPYGWTVTGGSLPPGLTLSGAGVISGTPTLVGSYPLTLRVQDAATATDMKSWTIRVLTPGGNDWSVLGKSVPTVTEIVVDPNNRNRIIAATTNIDAIFESTNAGDSWHPISINNGLNMTGRNLVVNPVNSEIWTISQGQSYYLGPQGWAGVSDGGYQRAGLAIGASGTAYTSRDYNYFTFFNSMAHAPWQSIHFSNNTQCIPGNQGAFAAGGGIGLALANASIFYTTFCVSLDAGVSWADITNGSSGRYDVSVSTSNSNDVLKAGRNALGVFVERTIDGGRNWTRSQSDLGSGAGIQLRRSSSNSQIAIAGTDQGLYKSSDGGSTWSRLSVNGVNNAVTAVAIDPSDAATFYIAAADGVKRSRDGGLTWTTASSGLVRRVMRDVKASPVSSDEIAIASAEGPFLSRTKGDTWTKSTPGMGQVSARRLGISGADANLYFAGTDDAVYRSANRGVTWTRVDGGVATGFPVMALEADPFDARYALFSLSGSRGTYRSTDGGLTFASANVGLPYGTPNDLSFARDVAHAGRVFVALTNDGLYRSEDRGANWSALGLNGQTVRAVEPAASDSNFVYAAGATLMYFFDPAIGTWQAATTGPANPILCLAVDANNKLVAYAGADHPGTAGNTGGVYKTTDGGRTWTRLAGILDQLDVVALAAHPRTSNIVWAATDNGGVFRTDDGGVTWKELGNYGTVADLTNVNVPDPSNQFLLFAATAGYGVQASTDGGKTFVPRVTGLGNLYVNALAFDPTTPSTLYAATDNGMYKSADSGNNWAATPLSSGKVTDLVTDTGGTGKLIWATVAGQGVAYSPDGGATFTVNSTGLSSLELTSLEVENRGTGKRIWATMKGGDGIAYSDNLGQTWTTSAGNGLTDRNINDLAIQSGTGKRIWATANSGVFVSKDDGLSWSSLSAGLPSGIPATSVSIDPNSGDTLVSLFSTDGGGVYRGGGVNGVWRPFSSGLAELKVRKLTRTNGYSIDSATLGARFYAATAGDGVYSAVLTTSVANAPVVTTYNLPHALLRQSYAATLTASGGTAPYTWSIAQGALPSGLVLNSSTGAISGEPGASGFFTFTAQVADANQRIGTKELVIDVVSADTLQVTQATPGLGIRGTTLNVTVRGSQFVATPTVSFGAGATVNGVTFVSSSELTVNLTLDAAGTPGYRTITVTNPNTTSASLVDGFKIEYPTPAVTGVAPTDGSQKQTLNVAVSGTNFESGATVSFGAGVTVNTVTVTSATSLTANLTVASNATLGTRDVTVTNVSGFSGSRTAAFNVRAAKPQLISVTPSQGNQGATFSVTLAGADFQSGATIAFGPGITVTSTSFVSITQMTATIAIASNAALGYQNATVTNPDGQNVTLTNALRVMGPAPQVVSAYPVQGVLGQTLTVTVNGTGLQAGAVVSFGSGVTVNTTTLLSNTQISANITIAAQAAPGMRTVSVTNLDGQIASLPNGFEVRALAPVVSSVAPAQGARGATLNVTLAGSDFRSGATISFGADIIVTNVVVPSATQATASISVGDAAALGLRGVTLTNADGQASTLASSFTVRDFAPSIVSVEPAALGPCGSGQFVVKGYHFRQGAVVSFGDGVTVSGVSLLSESSLSLSLNIASTAAAGPRTVTVTNPDGQSGASPAAFQVSPPAYVAARATYAWVDASGGTDSGLSGDDVAVTIPIGFAFPFYGATYTSVSASSNGYLTFGGLGTAFENVPIPTASQPNNMIAVYWDDLRVLATAGKVTYQLLGSAPARRLVVQWSGVTTTASTKSGTFEAILNESDGSIGLQYQDVTFGDPLHDSGVSATIGVENGAGSSGVQISYNTAGLAARSAYLVYVPACAAPPSISIGDVSVIEGNSGTIDAIFPVTLSAASTSTITVNYATADGTATIADSDYIQTSGTLTFAPGEISKTITVAVIGDTAYEPDETFSVRLSNPANATLARAEGIGTIVNDDPVGSLGAPVGVVATATTQNSVSVTWSAVAQAATYQVYRSSRGTNYALLGTIASPAFTDATASPATSYLYSVKAVNSANYPSGFSVPDLATTIIFTDATIRAGTTTTRVAHITELRTAVNAVRTLAGLIPSSFTDQSLSPGMTIRRLHVTELRAALDAARSVLNLPAMNYTDSTITTATTIKAAHITQLRDGVQ